MNNNSESDDDYYYSDDDSSDITLTKLYVTDIDIILGFDNENDDQFVTSMRENSSCCYSPPADDDHHTVVTPGCECFHCYICCQDLDDSRFILDSNLLERINKSDQPHILLPPRIKIPNSFFN